MISIMKRIEVSTGNTTKDEQTKHQGISGMKMDQMLKDLGVRFLLIF